MKLSTLLLSSLCVIDAKRDQSLLDQNLLLRQKGYTTGGNLKPKRLEEDITNIREQSRMYPFCSSGTPQRDNCYRKCRDSANCEAELVFYSSNTQDIIDCRKSTPKHIAKADACVKMQSKNALMNGQIDFNGEVPDKHVHKTVEINAPSDMFIQLTVEDFNIGAKNMEIKTPGGEQEKCGYGGIFVFSGEGAINQMIRITEFCGSKDAPVIDYVNEKYGGKTDFYSGITAQIQSSRVIIAVMTNEHFSEETIGNATASIKWDIVSPPESELIRGVGYLTDRIGETWRRIACEEADGLVVYEEGTCKQIEQHDKKNKYQRKYKRFSRFYTKTLQILDKAPRMAHLKCYGNGQGPAVLLPRDSFLITDYYAAESTTDLIKLIQNLLAYLMRDCKLQVFWHEKMNQIQAQFDKFTAM